MIVSLANTGEVLSIVNRPGNRPSHEGAAEQLDLAILLCRDAGFRRIYLRGDTDFTQTKQLDAWDAEGVTFLFGIDAMPNLKAIAEDLPASDWAELQRPPQYTAKGKPRKRPEKVKDRIVRERGFKTLTRVREDVAEVAYRPTACQRTYRLIIVRQTIQVEEGQARLFDEIRYRFYLTNDREATPRELVFKANDRCDQENLIAQLKGGVHALRAAVDNLVSNWAYMVMTALAWNLKAWFALSVPGAPAAQGGASRAEAWSVADGVQAVRERDHPDAVPDRPGWAPAVVSVVVVERVARGVPAGGSCAAVLKRRANRSRDLDVPVHRGVESREAEAGVTMKRPKLAQTRRPNASPMIVRPHPRS